MVGDGLNDTPALATADIGISMGISGSALVTQTGHIILMSNDIRKIRNAIKLARRAHGKVIQNVVLSITIKGGILVLAFAGYPLIWAAVLADVGTCLLVILNSMLLLREDKTENKCNRPSSSESDGHKEIETGLIGRSNVGRCNSGCCGKNNQEDAMRRRETCSDHCHSGSCQKKLEDNVELVKQNHCMQPTEALNGKHEGLSDSGCRDNKTQSLYQKCAVHLEGLQVKSSWNGGSDCCVSKNKKAKENIIISREDQSDLEKGRLISTKGNCKAGCCGSDKQTRETTKAAAVAKTENQDSFTGC